MALGSFGAWRILATVASVLEVRSTPVLANRPGHGLVALDVEQLPGTIKDVLAHAADV
jgi:hypothetical protein